MKKEWLGNIIDAVYAASEAIMNVYKDNFEIIIKSDDSPVTLADKQSNHIISTELAKTGILIVSEESAKPDYETRKNQPIWLLDPLDGTKEFINKNGDFCICIAFVEDHFPTFGLIADPINKKIIFGGQTIHPALIQYGEKDLFNERHFLEPVPHDDCKRIIYSRTHYTPNIDILVSRLEKTYGPCERILKGSALKFFDLVTNKAQVYPRLWPTMEWDIAAGHAIYHQLGGEVVDFTTFAPLQYNKESLFNPKFIAKPKKLIIEQSTNE